MRCSRTTPVSPSSKSAVGEHGALQLKRFPRSATEPVESLAEAGVGPNPLRAGLASDDSVYHRAMSDHACTQEQEPGSTLYHYTSWAGLEGIVGNQQIWATDFRFLNDYSELSHGRAQMVDALRQRAAAILDGPPRVEISADPGAQIDDRPTLLNQVADQVEALGTQAGHGPYIVSFCEHRDLLSQWRSYGSSGYAIGFDRQDLLRIPPQPLQETLDGKVWIDQIPPHPPSPVSLVQVSYGSWDEPIEEFVADVMRTPVESVAHSYLELEPAWRAEDTIATFKHAGFFEEQEWRLIAHGGVKRCFRPSPTGALIPYAPIPIPGLVPKEIVVGPTMPSTTEFVLREWLGQRNLDVSVSTSRTPYRAT
jgi:hypothetical protein